VVKRGQQSMFVRFIIRIQLRWWWKPVDELWGSVYRGSSRGGELEVVWGSTTGGGAARCAKLKNGQHASGSHK
jgi:hypothetical protein